MLHAATPSCLLESPASDRGQRGGPRTRGTTRYAGHGRVQQPAQAIHHVTCACTTRSPWAREPKPIRLMYDISPPHPCASRSNTKPISVALNLLEPAPRSTTNGGGCRGVAGKGLAEGLVVRPGRDLALATTVPAAHAAARPSVPRQPRAGTSGRLMPPPARPGRVTDTTTDRAMASYSGQIPLSSRTRDARA